VPRLVRASAPNHGWVLSPLGHFTRLPLGLLLGLGLYLLVRTIGLFARFGEGTLAPWSPT